MTKVMMIISTMTICIAASSTPLIASDYATSADKDAMREISKTPWVKDVYVSPGHFNVGVLRSEKDWSSPMIGKWICAKLSQAGSVLPFVRFVDIKEVVDKGMSPNQAEISKFECHK